MSYEGREPTAPFIVERGRENGESCGLPLPPQRAPLEEHTRRFSLAAWGLNISAS